MFGAAASTVHMYVAGPMLVTPAKLLLHTASVYIAPTGSAVNTNVVDALLLGTGSGMPGLPPGSVNGCPSDVSTYTSDSWPAVTEQQHTDKTQQE